MTIDTSVSSPSLDVRDARRDYLVAWRWLRLGARLPLRLDLLAPEPLQCAFMAFADRRKMDPLAVSLRDCAWYVFPPAAGPAAPVPAGLPAPAAAQALISAPAQSDPLPRPDFVSCACGGAL